MTIYQELLDRQKQLQEEGVKLGQPREVSFDHLQMAYLDELGELIHELKPKWSWWKKPGGSKTVDPEQVVGEAADLLHFVLINTLERPRLRDRWWVPEDEVMQVEVKDGGKLAWRCLTELARGIPDLDIFFTDIAHVMALVGKDVDDLVAEYFRKSEANLKRWNAVPQGAV